MESTRRQNQVFKLRIDAWLATMESCRLAAKMFPSGSPGAPASWRIRHAILIGKAACDANRSIIRNRRRRSKMNVRSVTCRSRDMRRKWKAAKAKYFHTFRLTRITKRTPRQKMASPARCAIKFRKKSWGRAKASTEDSSLGRRRQKANIG